MRRLGCWFGSHDFVKFAGIRLILPNDSMDINYIDGLPLGARYDCTGCGKRVIK